MQKTAFGLALLIATSLSAKTGGQAARAAATPGSHAADPPLYRISFERREAVAGLSTAHAIKLPWECTSDGTIFAEFVQTVPANAGVPPPPPATLDSLLTSVSLAGRGHIFPLDQIPDLYVSEEVDHYASDSGVVFLVWASRENKPVKQTYTVGGLQGQYTRNAAEKHLYIVSFSLDGDYRRAVEIEDAFRIRRLGVFPSGTFLAFGFDSKDHSPRLVMLKEDGTLLKAIEIPKADAPESMVGTFQGRRSVTAPTELVPEGRSILIVQNRTTFPLLEIDEGGSIRAIRPKLPKGKQIESAIPADRNLYVIASPESLNRGSAGVIYEVSHENGTLLRRFELSDGRRTDGVACVHDGRFLSIDYGEDQVVPLVGTAEPATATAAQHKQ